MILRTSEMQTNAVDYSNDKGDCGCQVRNTGSMAAALHIMSRLTTPVENRKDNKEDSCGPYMVISHSGTNQSSSKVLSYQCPRVVVGNDTSSFVLHFGAQESVTVALVNEQEDEVRSFFNITLLTGTVEMTCGQSVQAASECPCIFSDPGGAPRTGDTKLADRFVAAIVASVIFLVLCGVVFCIYMIMKKRKAKKGQEGGPTPEKTNIDGSTNQAYTGSLKSLEKQSKPEKLPRTKYSPDKPSPEKDDVNTSYIRYNSNDALNLSLQQPTGKQIPTGLSSIIGTADVRGSTESGIYSSADLIGPDQMYGPNGTPQRPKPGVPPRTPSKEELDAVYAKPNKPRPPADYYSNVPGEPSPYSQQPAALPPRSASQDRLDGRRAGSFERLDGTPMTQRTPSHDRLDTSRDNTAFVAEQRQQHGSKTSLSETDV